MKICPRTNRACEITGCPEQECALDGASCSQACRWGHPCRCDGHCESRGCVLSRGQTSSVHVDNLKQTIRRMNRYAASLERDGCLLAERLLQAKVHLGNRQRAAAQSFISLMEGQREP